MEQSYRKDLQLILKKLARCYIYKESKIGSKGTGMVLSLQKLNTQLILKEDVRYRCMLIHC
jgi:hypothetical protein